MFTNYWYIIAIGAMFSIITNSINEIWIASLFFIWVFYLFYKNRIPLAILLATCLSFIFFYFYIPSIDTPLETSLQHVDSDMRLHGKIITPVQIKESSVQFTFEEHNKQSHVLVIYFIDTDEFDHTQTNQLRYGATCTISGELSLPQHARNPHQFDFQRHLLKSGITYQLIVDDITDISCSEQKSLQYIYSLRDKFIQISSEKLQEETASWMQALVLGNSENIDEETIKLFQRWSLSHILAISGLHIGIVVAIIYLILVRFSMTTKETAQTILLFFLPIYALLAGGQPSVWRASLTVVLGILIIKWKLKINYTDTISIIFLALIIINPYIGYHIGFQFSFLVSFGLILSQKWILQTHSNLVRVLQISFISQMVILPLQIHYFFTFQPLSILLNVIVVPYFSIFVIPILFILLLVIYLPLPIIQIFENVFLFSHNVMMTLIEIVDEYLYFPMVIGTFPIYFSIIYYLCYILFMQCLESEEKTKSLLFGIVTSLVLITLVIRPYLSPVGKVTMLDIGQGDAFIIELPYRKGVFIIDAGARFNFSDFTPTESVYQQVIRPYLLGEGIYQIDAIFISHADLDHNGSVNLLMEEFQINNVVISEFYPVSKTEKEIWQNSNKLVQRVRFNEKIEIKGHSFHTLSPKRDKYSENENSLVLYTEVGGAWWLFTGDIDKQTEREIVQQYPNLKIDILKVSHHGSNTSTDPYFIEQIEPTYALISAGVENRFGHPTDEVLQTLLEEAIKIYRTDEDGAVQYIFKDNQGFFKTFLPVRNDEQKKTVE